jgi:L-histidine Nalpha-methyltransferase
MSEIDSEREQKGRFRVDVLLQRGSVHQLEVSPHGSPQQSAGPEGAREPHPLLTRRASHCCSDPAESSNLAADVFRGLQSFPKSVPPKYFYDDHGSELFDRICETAEYYQTRTEQNLLETVAPLLMDGLRPTDVVELGSGAARKTRTLFDAAESYGLHCRYIPFDVSEGALRRSAELLMGRYPWLQIHGVIGDYDRHLGYLPAGERRLFVFLGGTIGNFPEGAAIGFLRSIAQAMTPHDRLLLGTDLIKDPATLDRAYNDSRGCTAAFNKNVLSVINRELGGHFDLDAFRHVAFFNENDSQVEMHLESVRHQSVLIDALGLKVNFQKGERLLTEISRKFTRASVRELLDRAGFTLQSWHESPSPTFGLSLSAPNLQGDQAHSATSQAPSR